MTGRRRPLRPRSGLLARHSTLACCTGLLLTAGLTHGCMMPAAKPDPHYVLEAPYRCGPIWCYPRESFDLDETGLASIVANNHAPLTTDGEVFDQTALAAAHASIQLPAIARVTNLENGLQVTLRVNDRGSADPRRLLEVTRRTATLLGITGDAVTRVRLQVLPGDSRAALDGLPGAPRLAMAAAPRGVVEVAELAPPPGVRQASQRIMPSTTATSAVRAADVTPPMRLPEVVLQTTPQPGRMMVRLDTFDSFQYAAEQQARMRAVGARIVDTWEGRAHRFRVEIGPFQEVAAADAILLRAFATGIPDARITID